MLWIHDIKDFPAPENCHSVFGCGGEGAVLNKQRNAKKKIRTLFLPLATRQGKPTSSTTNHLSAETISRQLAGARAPLPLAAITVSSRKRLAQTVSTVFPQINISVMHWIGKCHWAPPFSPPLHWLYSVSWLTTKELQGKGTAHSLEYSREADQVFSTTRKGFSESGAARKKLKQNAVESMSPQHLVVKIKLLHSKCNTM